MYIYSVQDQITYSFIIPVLNEESTIGRLIENINVEMRNGLYEIIVVDGGSKDQTLKIVFSTNAILLESNFAQRAEQFNEGARFAKGKIFIFLHADSILPSGVAAILKQHFTLHYGAACFRLKFDRSHWLLTLLAWFTRFNFGAFRFGDQSLIVRRKEFDAVGAYPKDHVLLEDQKMARNLRKITPFKVIPKNIITSSRKYNSIGIMKLQFIYFRIFFLYYLGYPQNRLVEIYKRCQP